MLKKVLAASVLAGFGFAAQAATTTLVVYTTLETDQYGPYKAEFERQNPDIKIQWLRDQGGTITAKLLAEKANPKADVVWALAATQMNLLKQGGVLQAYSPTNINNIDPQFRDPEKVPYWVGMDAYASVICFNTVEAKKYNLPAPKTWQDLTNPIYAGKIVMPNPISSGAGYMAVTSWLTTQGEEKGWQYMDKLHANIAQYIHSGSKPCTLAATGEYPIGISFEYRGLKSKKSGAPIDIIVPDNIGWEIEATGIVKGTKKLDAAKKLADFSASKDAMRLYEKNYVILAIPRLMAVDPLLPSNFMQKLVKTDFTWSTNNKQRIQTEWTKRYDNKSAPK